MGQKTINALPMTFLENRLPPPLVAALFGLAIWLLSPLLPAVPLAGSLRLALSLLALLLGAFVSLLGVAAFRRARTTVNPLRPKDASQLVTAGIYRFSRNPMYLGMACVLLAFAIWFAVPWNLLGVLGFVLYMNRFQIQPEEQAMAALFGDEFERYRQTVRRWL